MKAQSLNQWNLTEIREQKHGSPSTQYFSQPRSGHQPDRVRDQGNFTSHRSVNATQDAFQHPVAVALKAKGKLASPPVIPQTPKPINNASSFQPLIRKRKLHLNERQTGQANFETKLSLCTRCQQYLIPVSDDHLYLLTHSHHVTIFMLLSSLTISQGTDPGMCTSCLQESDIYKWPSISSSRMENLESLVLFLMPCKSPHYLSPPYTNKCSTHGGMPPSRRRQYSKGSIMAAVSLQDSTSRIRLILSIISRSMDIVEATNQVNWTFWK